MYTTCRYRRSCMRMHQNLHIYIHIYIHIYLFIILYNLYNLQVQAQLHPHGLLEVLRRHLAAGVAEGPVLF
jgi:hypothetical protein